MKFKIGIVLIVLLSLAIAAASVDLNKENIVGSYGKGDSLRGTINVSFEDTDLDSSVETSFGHSISLRKILELNEMVSGEDYNCTNARCLADYTREGEIANFNFVGGKRKFGFALQGQEVSNVDGVKFVLQGDSGASCFGDLRINLFGSEDLAIISSRYADQTCYGPRRGCFETNRNDYSYVIVQPSTVYCEKMTLPSAPAFRLGTSLIKSTQGNATLKMGIYNLQGGLLKECTLTQPTQDGQEIECIVPLAIAEQGEYFACLQATGTSNYKIKTETNAACGTNNFGSTYPGDYDIYVKDLAFDSPRIEISQSSFFNNTGFNLAEYVNNYVSDVYGGSCTPYCIIPFEIEGSGQNIVLSDAYIRYSTSLGAIESSSLYSLSSSDVKIDSEDLILDIGKANFTLPQNAKTGRLKISIDGEQIVSKIINISAGFDFGINRQYVIFGKDTAFSVVGSVNITKATWRFGDESAAQTSNGKTITHRYVKQGTFNLEVEATSTGGVVSKKTFSIIVGDPKSSANFTLNQTKNDYVSLTSSISRMPTWIQQATKDQLGYSEINKSIAEITLRFQQAATDEDYAEVVNDLNSIKIPSSIVDGVKGKLPLGIGLENSDPGLIEAIDNRDVNDQDLRDAYAYWMNSNGQPIIEFSSASAVYFDSSEPIMTKFKIETHPKETSSFSGSYLIIPISKDDLTFAQEYSVKEVEGASYVTLSSGNQAFEFLVLDEIDAESLGIYISPNIDVLGNFEGSVDLTCNYDDVCGEGESSADCGDCKPWGRIILWIAIIIFIGLLGWLALQWYYKNSYEKRLFSNKQDMSNIAGFIAHARNSKLTDKEIQKKLKNAGWNGEQIQYMMKKSKTLKIEEHRDVRFIKRPDFR